jgi:hypothetical protein
MAGLLEIVFEDVGKDLILPLLEAIISDSESIVGAGCSEGFPVCEITGTDHISSALSTIL